MSDAKRRKLAELLAKDKPGLHDDAARLAMAGRKGDKLVAHITPEEAMLLKARGGAGTINPRTGLLEFYDGSDPMGSGSDYGSTNDGLGGGYGGSDPMGSGADYTPSAGWSAPDISGLGGVSSDPGEQYAMALQQGYQPLDVATRLGDFAGRQISNKIADVQANPARTVLDAAIGFIPGVGQLNTLAGLAGFPTLGGGITSAARGISGYGNTATVADSAKGQTVGALADGDSKGPLDGGDSRGSGDGGPLSTNFGAPPNPNAALAQALAGTPSPQSGKMTFGAPVNSFDPNGRRYVTPWAMRG
jgi:hypothetical protein